MSLIVLKGWQVKLDLRDTECINGVVLKGDTTGWDKSIDVHCSALFLREGLGTFATQHDLHGRHRDEQPPWRTATQWGLTGGVDPAWTASLGTCCPIRKAHVPCSVDAAPVAATVANR